jgi:hypothetical protein
VLTTDGNAFVSVGRRTTEEAEKLTMKECNKESKKKAACALVMTDDQAVAEKPIAH